MKKKKVKKNFNMDHDKGKQKKMRVKKSIASKPSETSDDKVEYLCLMCLEPFSSSKPGGQWVQCMVSDLKCTKQEDFYICQICDSDIYFAKENYVILSYQCSLI